MMGNDYVTYEWGLCKRWLMTYVTDECRLKQMNGYLSYDIAPGSEITPCNIIVNHLWIIDLRETL